MNKYIDQNIDKLLDDFPIKHKKPISIDLILDGGLFNGSYLLGCMLYIKKLEKKNILKIERVSVCSISSIIILFYLFDQLDLFEELYEKNIEHLKNNYNLNVIARTLDKIKPFLPSNISSILNNKVYISYYHISKGKRVISNFKSINHLFDVITRSCFIPFAINGQMLHKKKFMDGITPYIIPNNNNRKRLHIELVTWDKFINIFSIKNESSNLHRILTGILDIHLFFTKNHSTDMCKYISDWKLMNIDSRFIVKLICEKVMYQFILLISIFNVLVIKNVNISPINDILHYFNNISQPYLIKFLCL